MKNKRADIIVILGVTGLALISLCAVLGPILITHNPYEIQYIAKPLPPHPGNLFGTDQLGRDIFSRTLIALRATYFMTLAASLTALLLGVLIGSAAGYFGGFLDILISGLLDCILAFPSILLAIAISAALGPGTTTLFISLATASWAATARIIRSHVQELRSKEFVLASRLMGANHFYILTRHLFPHVLPLISVLFFTNLASLILTESSLSFLGFGLPPPHPSLGKLIYDGARYLRIAPWWSFFPGLFIAITILSLNIIGDSFQRNRKPNPS